MAVVYLSNLAFVPPCCTRVCVVLLIVYITSTLFTSMVVVRCASSRRNAHKWRTLTYSTGVSVLHDDRIISCDEKLFIIDSHCGALRSRLTTNNCSKLDPVQLGIYKEVI